ncbi:hypothetical protein UY3_07107 [Chelonia mydas]|uniref:Uncharacterized protein n=1 Tax=Chelonia mydas TaxID=8469 RepID=M7C5E8_CHEMY|nr:hypothetical protein UY3_07107 [Chelonia mydas]
MRQVISIIEPTSVGCESPAFKPMPSSSSEFKTHIHMGIDNCRFHQKKSPGFHEQDPFTHSAAVFDFQNVIYNHTDMNTFAEYVIFNALVILPRKFDKSNYKRNYTATHQLKIWLIGLCNIFKDKRVGQPNTASYTMR